MVRTVKKEDKSTYSNKLKVVNKLRFRPHTIVKYGNYDLTLNNYTLKYPPLLGDSCQ